MDGDAAPDTGYAVIEAGLGLLVLLAGLVGCLLARGTQRRQTVALVGVAVLVTLLALDFVRRLRSPDRYFDDGRTYWEWGGVDPSHRTTYAYMAVSAICVGALLLAALRTTSPAGPRRRGRLIVACCVLASISWLVANMGAFSGH